MASIAKKYQPRLNETIDELIALAETQFRVPQIKAEDQYNLNELKALKRFYEQIEAEIVQAIQDLEATVKSIKKTGFNEKLHTLEKSLEQKLFVSAQMSAQVDLKIRDLSSVEHKG